jgi:hypothetical protein
MQIDSRGELNRRRRLTSQTRLGDDARHRAELSDDDRLTCRDHHRGRGQASASAARKPETLHSRQPSGAT